MEWWRSIYHLQVQEVSERKLWTPLLRNNVDPPTPTLKTEEWSKGNFGNTDLPHPHGLKTIVYRRWLWCPHHHLPPKRWQPTTTVRTEGWSGRDCDDVVSHPYRETITDDPPTDPKGVPKVTMEFLPSGYWWEVFTFKVEGRTGRDCRGVPHNPYGTLTDYTHF